MYSERLEALEVKLEHSLKVTANSLKNYTVRCALKLFCYFQDADGQSVEREGSVRSTRSTKSAKSTKSGKSSVSFVSGASDEDLIKNKDEAKKKNLCARIVAGNNTLYDKFKIPVNFRRSDKFQISRNFQVYK